MAFVSNKITSVLISREKKKRHVLIIISHLPTYLNTLLARFLHSEKKERAQDTVEFITYVRSYRLYLSTFFIHIVYH